MSLKTTLDIEQALERIRVEYKEPWRIRRAFLKAYRLLKRGQTPRAIMVIGQTGSGKTTLLQRIQRGIMRTIRDRRRMRVVYVRLDPQTNEKALLARILATINHPQPEKASRYVLTDKLRNLLRDMGVRVILLDECHHLISGKKLNFKMAEMIKMLIDELGVLFVLVGVERLEVLLKENSEFERRVDVYDLPAFNPDDEDDQHTLRNILDVYDEELPFYEYCGFALEPVAFAFNRGCRGLLGHIVPLIAVAADHAIQARAARIEPEHLAWAWEQRLRRTSGNIENPFASLKPPPRRFKPGRRPNPLAA